MRVVHYAGAYVVLLLLSGLTLGLSYVSLGPWESPLAMGIALAKATVLAAVFMHLAQRRFSNVFALLTGVFFLVLLTALASADLLTRDVPPVMLEE